MITTGKHGKITLLDGGMGREMLRMGAPFRQPEWSALSLMQAPGLVKKAHELFAAAGSDILTTSNYAVVPFHLGKERFLAEGAELTTRAGRLTREAATPFNCLVAGSIPPLFGSYRPDLFVPEQAPPLLKIIIDSLSPHVDLWIAETVSSIAEAREIAEALSSDNRPLWISFTILDNGSNLDNVPHLRSGEDLIDAVRAVTELDTAAVLFNCSQPEAMAPAVEATMRETKRQGIDLPVGVYANAFPAQQKEAQANEDLMEIRSDLDPSGYLDFVDHWLKLGTTILGGCCGIGPEHIEALHNRLLI